MSKIRETVCDICGKSLEGLSIYQQASRRYCIKRYWWAADPYPDRLDLCEACYRNLERWILDNKGDKE